MGAGRAPGWQKHWGGASCVSSQWSGSPDRESMGAYDLPCNFCRERAPREEGFLSCEPHCPAVWQGGYESLLLPFRQWGETGGEVTS